MLPPKLPESLKDDMLEEAVNRALEEGTDVNVFFETEGWVFAEFDCEMGTIRAWLPAEYVAVGNE